MSLQYSCDSNRDPRMRRSGSHSSNANSTGHHPLRRQWERDYWRANHRPGSRRSSATSLPLQDRGTHRTCSARDQRAAADSGSRRRRLHRSRPPQSQQGKPRSLAAAEWRATAAGLVVDPARALERDESQGVEAVNENRSYVISVVCGGRKPTPYVGCWRGVLLAQAQLQYRTGDGASVPSEIRRSGAPARIEHCRRQPAGSVRSYAVVSAASVPRSADGCTRSPAATTSCAAARDRR